MRDDRSVWIVGDPEEGTHATTHRYHRGDCYVLDHVGNRGRTRKLALAALPEGYAPCQICAHDRRSSTAASVGSAWGTAQRSTGVQPGHLVDVEDVDTGRISTYRIASSDRPFDFRRDLAAVAPRGRLGREAGASGC